MATSVSQLGGEITRLVGQYRDGDRAARDRLIDLTYERFERLTHQMLDGYPALRRWEQTGDVFHRALFRLLAALEDIRPESSAHFLRLAALQIRRELRDLVRHHFGPRGPAAHHDTGRCEPGSSAGESRPFAARDDGPSTLAELTEFHEAVEDLPEELRLVVDLHFYQGLTHEEAADIVGVDVRTVKRRWRRAQLVLGERFYGLPPGGGGT